MVLDDPENSLVQSPREVDVSEQAWGSDLIADMVKALGFEYVSYNPGASFRGIEESMVNYNDDVPRTIEVANEGLSVSIAHGYAKATGEPALCVLHDTVGTLNGSMGIFNAYADHAPVVILSGNGPLRKSERRPWIDWIHSNISQGSLVQDYIKWFDEPAHADGVPETLIRARNVAATPRKGPVYVTMDHDLQEYRLDEPTEIPDLDRFEPPSRMAPDPALVDETADRLVEADMPVLLTDQVGQSRAGVDALVEIAELLGSPVVCGRHRYNFPTDHPLYFESIEPFPDTDVMLAVDVRSLPFLIHGFEEPADWTPVFDGDPITIEIGIHDVDASSLVADYHALYETDLPIMADSAVALPALADAIRDRLGDRDHDAIEDRRGRVHRINEERHEEWERAVEAAWDEEPISLTRMVAEVWDVIRDEDWVLVSARPAPNKWIHRLWEMNEFDQYTGGSSGGGGVGYCVGGAIGGALAYEDTDRIPVFMESDGDLMQFPSGLWTVAHYDLPMFTVVHNNQSLYNSTNHRMELAAERNRDDSYERALVGSRRGGPVPDYAGMAESFGVNGYGPIEDPGELRPALEAAWRDVANGEPALVDVVSQAR